jgi:hypothetical protein
MLKPKSKEISILSLKQSAATFCLLGMSPLIYHSASLKTLGPELLLPKGRKTAADKAQSLKHDPLKEYRASTYAHLSDDRPTRLMFPCSGFKQTIAGAAVDIPGATKAAINRLTWINERDVDIYGIPQLHMRVVWIGSIDRVPDIRTSATLPTWAAYLTVKYATPMLSDVVISRLLAAGGLIRGLGDWRQEKGGSFGTFELVSENDERFRAAIRNGGREAQDQALAQPEFFDVETKRLYEWYENEIGKMGDKAPKREAAE